MSSKNQPAPGAASLFNVGQGSDTLWRHQLRKENAAIWEKLEECAKVNEAWRSEASNQFRDFNERIVSLEATASTVESTEAKASQARDMQSREVANLSLGVVTMKRMLEKMQGDFLDTRVTPQQQEEGLAMTVPTPTQPTIPEPISERTPDGLSVILTNPPDVSFKNKYIPISVSAPAVKSNIATRITTSRKRPIASTIAQQNIPATRDTPSRSPSSHHKNITVFPRLVQGGHTSIKTYHCAATNAFSKLTLDKGGETEFVARFIKGIHNISKQSVLVTELEKTNPSFTEAGEQRVLCEWSDVSDALKKSGLVAAGDAQDAPPAKRKKRVLIPLEMIKDGMMK